MRRASLASHTLNLSGRAPADCSSAEALVDHPEHEEVAHVVERSPVFDDDPGTGVPVPSELSSHPGRHCLGVDTEVFFPVSELGVLQARLVCTGCPVRVACREWAAATGQYGVWGGTTREERAAQRHADIAAAAAAVDNWAVAA